MRSRLALPDYFRAVDVFRDSTHPKGLGDELGRHFLKREGALIDYPCVCIMFTFSLNFFSACTCEIDAALE